ncbi:hypothetical protein [Sphingobium xenophagum]|uniref:hypothetical protein n=1 Tax=Sphingobium xenophagum TaxID=121428 RepID=UPI0013EE73AC|nr:hypothetical protein [Sphingobium xenophagum]
MADPILYSFRRQHGFEAADCRVIDRLWFDMNVGWTSDNTISTLTNEVGEA